MPLKDYSTKIAASKTAAEVQAVLAKAGATDVAMRYRDGEPTAIAFIAPTPFGPREFTLPADPEAVQRVLRKQRVQASFQTLEHSRRVAWRIVKDWIEAQLAIIETEMVTIDQVMLPYMRGEDGRTVFEQYSETQQLLLESGGGQA